MVSSHLLNIDLLYHKYLQKLFKIINANLTFEASKWCNCDASAAVYQEMRTVKNWTSFWDTLCTYNIQIKTWWSRCIYKNVNFYANPSGHLRTSFVGSWSSFFEKCHNVGEFTHIFHYPHWKRKIIFCEVWGGPNDTLAPLNFDLGGAMAPLAPRLGTPLIEFIYYIAFIYYIELHCIYLL